MDALSTPEAPVVGPHRVSCVVWGYTVGRQSEVGYPGRGSNGGGSDASRGSDRADNHFPSPPARANQETVLNRAAGDGRGSDF
jgi:hypothetical protein